MCAGYQNPIEKLMSIRKNNKKKMNMARQRFKEQWKKLFTREMMEQPACRNLFLWSAILMIPLQIGYHVFIMAMKLQQWLHFMPGIMWPASILLLIFYVTKSTSKPYLIATYVYFLLINMAHSFILGLTFPLAVKSKDSWKWLSDDPDILWGLAAFSFAEVVQFLIVVFVFRHTARKIRAKLGSGTSIY
uniref:Uncharacterized protein n=1 Tax=Acrobeloides nanus TaxID=290746 RepID=A0A914ECW7_9BILA